MSTSFLKTADYSVVVVNQMDRYRIFNGMKFCYYGSESKKEEAIKRAKNSGRKYRITQYGKFYKWGGGFDIWVIA